MTLFVQGERRIAVSQDYGSLMMMQHLNVGCQMIDEAEALVRHFGLMTPVVEEKIDDIRHQAYVIKYDNDLLA